MTAPFSNSCFSRLKEANRFSLDSPGRTAFCITAWNLDFNGNVSELATLLEGDSETDLGGDSGGKRSVDRDKNSSISGTGLLNGAIIAIKEGLADKEGQESFTEPVTTSGNCIFSAIAYKWLL